MNSRLLALLLACLLAPTVTGAKPPAGKVCGAKLVAADLQAGSPPPELRVVEGGDAWRLLPGEAWTGTNPREFFFTLQADSDPGREVPPPTVEVRWPGVPIARVLGAQGKPEPLPDGVRFRVGAGRAPTSVKTSLHSGFVHMAVFHNWEIRRAGPYREGPWPAAAIQAQLNFLFAAREMCRAMGFAGSADPGFTGDIRLYGFETNFPNGHEDHPPHFHIMLAWPGWLNTQAGHFRLDDAGRILRNELLVDDGRQVRRQDYGPGEICPLRDRDGRLGFELIVTDGGQGVIMRRAAGQPEFRLHPDPATGSALTGVEVSRRQQESDPWEPLCRVRAIDDPARGELKVMVSPAGRTAQAETIRYDPDTGEIVQ